MSQTETTPATEPAIPPDPIVHKSYAVPIWIASFAVVAATVLAIADEGWLRRPYKGVQAKYREAYSAYLEKVEMKRRAVYDGVLMKVEEFGKIKQAADDAAKACQAEEDKVQAELDTATDLARKMTEAAKEGKSEIAALSYKAETKAHAAHHERVEDAPEAKDLLEKIAAVKARQVEFEWTEHSIADDGSKTETKRSDTKSVADALTQALALEELKGNLQRRLAQVTADKAAASKARQLWLSRNGADVQYALQNCDDATRKAIAASGVAKYLDERTVALTPQALADIRASVEKIPTGFGTLLPGDSGIRQIHIKDAANWVDRCETCHLNARSPLPVTAESMREVLGSQVASGEDTLDAWPADKIDAMPLALFASHPRTELLKTHDPERFGCSMCHNGNGVAVTGVEFAHGNNHHWLWPLFPKENIEAGCVQCHRKDLVLPMGERINAGRDTFRRAGCWGCHKYEGFDSELDQITALDGRRKAIAGLRDAKQLRSENLQSLLTAISDDEKSFDQQQPGTKRERDALTEQIAALDIEDAQLEQRLHALYVERQRVGPNLKDIRIKLLPEFVTDWIRNPRESHKDASGAAFRPDTKMPSFRWWENPDEEIKDVAAFLWQSAYGPSDLKEYALPAFQPGDAKNGEKLFKEKGCVACHSVGTGADRVGNDYAANLSNLGEKNRPEYVQRWITNPRRRLAAYDPHKPAGQRDVSGASPDDAHLVWAQHTIMPNLRLTEAEARDITTFLTSQKRANVTYEAAPWLEDKARAVRGRKLVLYQGCAGCHEIRGLEDEKGIGTGLTTEGSKPRDQLDFGHHTIAAERGHEPLKGAKLLQDAATLFEEEAPWYRPRGFFLHKVAKPDVFEDAKLVTNRFERLRMPQFDFSAREILDVTTLLLGSVDNAKILPASMHYKPDEAGKAIQEGWWIVRKYNCQGCHQITPGDTPAIWSVPGIREKLGDTKLRDQSLPPTLVGVGARLRADFLAKFLRDPSLGGGREQSASTRKHLAVRMPTFDFSDDEIAKLVRFFQALSHQPAVEQPMKLEPLTDKEMKAASAIYRANGSCSQCHVVDGGAAPTAETRAPNFSYAPGRLRAEWMRRWIPKPTTMQPMTSMAPLFEQRPDGTWRFATKLPELEGVDGDHVELLIRYLLLGHAGK